MNTQPSTMMMPKIVVVNDDAIQLKLLTGLLAQNGYAAAGYGGAAAALERMGAAGAPELIVTDLDMPGIDGWRFCRLLRSPDYAAFNQTPILVVSATFSGGEAARLTAELGANAFLPAPVQGAEFIELVRRLLAHDLPPQAPGVLIVEDAPALCSLLADLFQSHGYRAEAARSGREAREKFCAGAYDLVLLDYHLPDILGDALLREFQAQRPETVFIMSTGDLAPGLALAWMKQGASAYVRKPFDPEYLFGLCENARRERSLLRIPEILERRTRELHEQEAWYRTILGNSSDALIVFDRNCRRVFISGAYQAITGYSIAERINKTGLDLVHPEDVPRIEAAFCGLLARPGATDSGQWRQRHKAGHWIWLEAVGTNPIESQGFDGIVMNIRDITERKRTEAVLAARLRLLRLAGACSLDELLQATLDEAEGLTGSKAGFYHFVEPGQLTLSLQAWSGNTQAQCRAEGSGRHYPVSQAGVWVDCIRERRPVIHNDYASLPHRKGLPEGHTPVIRELVVPVMRGEVVLAVLGVGNKAEDYDARDIETVASLADLAWDIVERKRAEAATRRAQEWFRTVFHASRDGIVAEADEIIVDCNPAFARFYGYAEPGDLIGKPVSVVQAPEDNERMLHFGQLRLRDEPVPDSYEFHGLRKDGSLVDAEASVSKVEISGRQYIISIIRDISERKRAEAVLTHSRDLLRYIIEHNRSAIAIHDRDLKYIYVSQRYLDDYVTGDRDIIGKHHYDVIPDIPQKWRDVHQRALAGEVSSKEDDTYVRSDGALEWTRWECRPWYAADGSIGGIIIYTEVITPRKRVEASLREAEWKFQALFENGPIAVAYHRMIYDDAGKPRDYYFLDANKKYLEFTGVDPRGKLVTQAFPGIEHDPFDWIGTFGRVAQSGASIRFEQKLQANDRWYDCVGYQYQPDHFVAAFFEITERKRAEEENAKLQGQLQQAQKLESVGRLAGGVAHDFNNMLGVIIGHAELALEQVAPAHPLHDDLLEIRKAAERSADLTRQLLAFARKQTVAPKVLDLNETVAGMLKMLQRLIGEDIDLAWHPGPDLGPVRIDPSQIDQILANLCVNARDAIAGVGKITIETGNSDFAEDYCAQHTGFVSGAYVRLVVNDSGRGMDRETLAQIFEPFFTTKGVGQGTGLGLATVYGAVKQNGGFINAASEPGRGATFTIYLPRSAGPAGPAAEGAAEPVPRGHETILLVEDEPTILKMTAKMLNKQGYTLLSVSTPGEAPGLAGDYAGEIHLLLTDVVMPGMNGRDLAQALHARYPRLKLLFMSGYTADVIAHQGVLDEGLNFIQKPFLMKDLAAQVRAALDGE